MARERLILTEKTAKIAESLEQKDSSIVLDQLKNVFAKVLQGFEVKWLGKQIDDLKIKEDAGSLTDPDKDLLGQLTKIFTAKKTEISIEVEEVFESIQAGRTVDAKNKARLITNKFGRDDVEYVADPTKMAEVLKVSEAIVEAGNSISNQDRVGVTESAFVAGAMVSGEKKHKEIVGKRTEAPIMSEVDEVVVRVGRSGTRKTFTQALAEAKNSGPKPKVELKDSVPAGPDRAKLNNQVFRGARNNSSWEIVNELIENGDTKIKEIIDKANLTKQQADFLLDVGNDLEKIETRLVEARLKEMTNKLDPTLRATRASKVKIAGVEVLHFSGPRKRRLERIVPLLNVERQDLDNIRVIMEAVSPGSNIANVASAEYIEANNIWTEYKNWHDKYGKFEEGVDQLKSRVEGRNMKQMFKDDDQSSVRGGIENQKATWTVMKNYIAGYNKDGSPKYTEEGNRLMELMKDLPMRLDEDGRLIPETLEQYVGRMNMEKRGPSMPGRERQELEALKLRMSPEDFRVEIKKRVVDSIKGIFSTGDSSRAPNNQPISWQLNDDLSMLDKSMDGDFRDLWMARLSSYDANIFMGTVETYDDFAKVASFLPREYLSILWEDKVELGTFTDIHGNKTHFELDFQGLRTTLSDTAPGEVDRSNIWLTKILDTDDMWGKYQGLKQFMAFKLAEQIGVRIEYHKGGTFTIHQDDMDKAQFVTADGQRINLMQLVGLNNDGSAMAPDSLEYQKIEDYDLYKEWGFFLNQPLIDMDLNLDSVELERGGGKKGKWRNLSNGLRKVHGAAMNDYLKWKHMGMPIGRDDGDSYWRSFLAWKLLDKNDEGTMTFLEPLRKKLEEKGITGDAQKKFFELFEHVVYMPERWKIQSVGGTKSGGLKSVAEIRHYSSKEYVDMQKYFLDFSAAGGASFDWGEILKLMGTNTGGIHTGEAGFQMFLQNFDLNRMITRKGLSHNLWFDFIKYTGTSSEYWKVLTQEVVHPGDPKLHGQLATIIEGYLGDLKEVKAKELMVRHGRYAQSDVDGYDTFVEKNSNGKIIKEDTVPWKIPKDSDELLDATQVAEAEKLGHTVLSDGRVVDENGRRIYRRGHFGFFKDILNPFAKKGFGSPYGRRNFGAESWKRRREMLYKQLNSGLMSPEAWEVENRRFQAELFLGVKLDWDKPVSVEEVKKKFKEKPILFFRLPYNLIRGLFVNSPVELGDLFAFLEPLNKEVGRQFSK